MAERSGRPTVPLLTDPQNRSESTTKDAQLINGYIEIVPSPDGETQYWVYKRPGLGAPSQPASGAANGYGVFNWRDDVYSIFADRLYKNQIVVAGTVDTTGGVYRFSSCLGATPKLVFGNGVAAYTYDSSNGLVEITDAQFPATFCKGWAYLNGTTYVMDVNAAIYGSEINDPQAWEADNVIIAQIEPDPGVALAKQLVYVIALKQWSVEVFYDAANATGSPLGRVEGAKASYGCVSQDSVQDLDGMLFWVGSSRTAGVQVFKLDNLKLEIISTPAVERLLQDADFTTVMSWQLSLDGHRFYGFTVAEENLTLVYDLDQRMWSRWVDEDGNYFPIAAASFSADNRAIFQHATNGYLYYVSASYTSDNGEQIIVDVITPNWDGGEDSVGKMVSRLVLITDQQAGAEVLVRYNDNDYAPSGWSNWRSFDISQRRPYLDNWGTFYRRSHWLRHKSNTRLRLKALEIQMSKCSI